MYVSENPNQNLSANNGISPTVRNLESKMNIETMYVVSKDIY